MGTWTVTPIAPAVVPNNGTAPLVDNANGPEGSSQGPIQPPQVTSFSPDIEYSKTQGDLAPGQGGATAQIYKPQTTWPSTAGAPPDIDHTNPTNEDALFRSMIAGNPINVKWPVVDQAKARYQTYQTTAGLTPAQLGDTILSWKIQPGSTTYNDVRNTNPELYAKTLEYVQWKKDMNQINALGMGIYNAVMKGTPLGSKIKYDVSDKTPPVSNVMDSYNTEIKNTLASKFWPEANKRYDITQQMLNTPQIQQQKQIVTDLEAQKNKLNEDIFKLDSDVRKQLWGEAPESLISAYISEKTKAIDWKLRTVDNQLTSEQATLKNHIDEVTSTLDYMKTGYAVDESNKKKTWSWVASVGNWAQALYDAWTNWTVADGELFNAWTLTKYWLKGASRWQVMKLLAQMAWSWNIDAMMAKVDWMSGDYWKDFATEIKKSLLVNQGKDYTKYLQQNYNWWESDVASTLKGLDKATATQVLDNAWVKSASRFWRVFWGKAGGKNKILNNI